MGKALRDEELTLVFGGEHHALPFAEGGTAFAQVDGDVEDRAAHDAHELGLRVVDLEVEPAQDALGARGLVVLNEIDVDTARDKVGLLVGFHEVAAIVAVALHVHDDHAVDGRLGEDEVTARDGISCCHD